MNKFYLYLLLVAVVGSALGIAFNTVKKQSLFQESLDKSAHTHDQALARIKEEYKVPEDTWNATMDAIANARVKDDLFTSGQLDATSQEPWIVQKIYEIAQQYGMNPARLTVKCVDADDVNLQAIQDFDENNKIVHLIEINLEWCNRHNRQMQEAFARHEMMHIYNYDGIEDGYITYMLDMLGHKPEDSAQHPAMIHFRHARELRADLLAGSNSHECAHALCQHYKQNISLDSNRPLQAQIMHPSAQDRATQLTQLLTRIDQQSTLA